MANRYKTTGQNNLKKKPPPPPTATTINNHHGVRVRPPLLHRKHPPPSPESTQLKGLMALLVSTAILLVLSGATLVTAVIGFVLFAPVIIITSPIWVPIGVVVFVLVAMVLSVSGVGLAAAAVLVVQLLIEAATHDLMVVRV